MWLLNFWIFFRVSERKHASFHTAPSIPCINLGQCSWPAAPFFNDCTKHGRRCEVSAPQSIRRCASFGLQALMHVCMRSLLWPWQSVILNSSSCISATGYNHRGCEMLYAGGFTCSDIKIRTSANMCDLSAYKVLHWPGYMIGSLAIRFCESDPTAQGFSKQYKKILLLTFFNHLDVVCCQIVKPSLC